VKSHLRPTILSFLVLLFGLLTPLHAANVAIKAGITPIIDQAQFYAAVDQGYFRDEGIDVEPVSGNNTAALLPGLTAGRLQFVNANIVTVLQGIEQGIQFRVVGPGTAMAPQPPDISPIVTLVDGAVKTPKDLEGRTLAVNSLNGILWLYTRAYLEKKGVDLAKVKFLEVPFPQQYDALIAGRIDAAGMTEPFATRSTESGKARVLGYPYTETQPNLQSVVLVTMADWARDNPDALQRYVRAYLKGQDYIDRNGRTPAGINIIASYTKMDPAVVGKIVLPRFPPSVDTKGIEETARLMVRYGLLKSMPDVQSVVLSPKP
jgi:NitT/TauT family transport system substrate-binding protein